MTTPFVFSSSQRESATDTLTDTGDQPMSARPRPPRYDALPFDAVLEQPPAGEDVFKPAPDPSRQEPVTAPVVFQKPEPVPQQAPAAPQSTPGHTLTRRELRAMLQAQEANQQAAPQASDAPAPPQSAVDVAPVAHLHAVPPIVDSPAAGRGEDLPTPISASPVSFAPVTVPARDDAEPAVPLPESSAPVAAPTEGETEVHHRRSFQPPTGHWSIAAAQDDDDDHTPPGGISRSAVSTGAATTSNALIMPIVPSVADATGPLTSTGEVLVTGSIDLPRGLGSTGQHPDHFDTSDLDRMFDQPDSPGENTASVAPVRASRAVSTHTSTRGMITPPNRRGNRLPTVLAITAAVLAVGVIGLLVAGYVFHAF